MHWSNNDVQKVLSLSQFPRSAAYDIGWLAENEMGPSSTWLAEFLAEAIDLQPGMKVMDLGCGKAMSSIFLAKEFGVQVWAVDLWIDATANYARVRESQIENLVYPIHAEAHALPFADQFFDVIVSLDAYHYFGTNEMYLGRLVRFLKHQGAIGIVVPGVHEEFGHTIPERLRPYWEPYLFTHHTPEWWSHLWRRSETVDIQVADTMPNGYECWLMWDRTLKEAGLLKRSGDVDMLEADGGNFTFSRIVANRR
jgi:cyclopropane fatty-acyl-phospholipid synthase-like methyltransferase